jgi:flagellar biogenesis protein FliO
MSPLAGYMLRTLVTLLAVSGLAVLVLFTSRRSGLGRSHGPLSVAGRLALDARRNIYLVRIGTIYYVLGVSEAGIAKLGELDAETLGPLDETPAGARPDFRELLARFGGMRSADKAGEHEHDPS